MVVSLEVWNAKSDAFSVNLTSRLSPGFNVIFQSL